MAKKQSSKSKPAATKKRGAAASKPKSGVKKGAKTGPKVATKAKKALPAARKRTAKKPAPKQKRPVVAAASPAEPVPVEILAAESLALEPLSTLPLEDEELITAETAALETVEDLPAATTPPAEFRKEHFEIKHDLKKRVDLYLRDRLPDCSRALIQKFVKMGHVLVNGSVAKSSTVLHAGDIVDVTLPYSVPQEFLPENIPLDIVYEDEGFIAINKQANLIVHPARGNWTGTLINALIHHAQQTQSTLSTGSDPWRPGIIHRLDRDTTGLILVAKTDEAHWRIAGQFERRTIRKTYLALVHGELDLDSDLIDAPLGVHPKIRERYAVRHDIGKPAQTVYTILERFRGYTLLELAPKTGRTHQLRVHMAYIKHPIVGDYTYGGQMITLRDIGLKAQDLPGKHPSELEKSLIDRQALHAFRLQFVHPLKFHRMHLEAKPPQDIEKILTLLRKYRPYVPSKR